MGYIKKLKNNELVGGTDKHTIYPVTSTEAVFEEAIKDGLSNFKSLKFLNNNITGDRINEGTITDYNIAEGTITKEKLTPQVQTMLDEGQKKAVTPKGNYNPEEVYEVLDLVFDPTTNSSYVSLVTPNTYPVDENAEGYEEGKWDKVLDGTAVNTAQAAINTKVGELDAQVTDAITQAEGHVDTKLDYLDGQVTDAIGQANQDIQDLIDASQLALQAATNEANDAAEEARDAASTIETLTSQQVADAQIGYFTCTNTAASGAADNETKITTSDAVGESHYVKTPGSHIKVKMAVANAHAAPVYLQFGSNSATRAQVYYNGAAVDASNTWDNNETISVFYDNNVYQASNAMGGGSAVGKKKLTPLQGYIENNGATLGSIHTASADKTNYRYIKYPAKEGDVVQISGTGASTAKLWGIVGEEDVMLDAAAANLSASDLVLVMPEGTAFITINSKTTSNPEWYYAKAGSVGAHEMLTESYLCGDSRVFTTGGTYKEEEAVKTEDNQLLKVIKETKAMTISEEVSVDDLRTYNGNTYKAQKDIRLYTIDNDSNYTAGDYAIGSPAGITIGASVENPTEGEVSVTFAGVTMTVNITSESDAASVAHDLSVAFGDQEKWALIDNEDGTLELKSKYGVASAPSVDPVVSPNNMGVAVSFVPDTSYTGSVSLSQYDGSVWNTVILADYAADSAAIGETDATKMWKILNIYELTKEATEQNHTPKLYNEWGDNTDGSLTLKFVTNYIKVVTETDVISIDLTNSTDKRALYANDPTAANFGTVITGLSSGYKITPPIYVKGCSTIRFYGPIKSGNAAAANIAGGVFYTSSTISNAFAIKLRCFVMGSATSVAYRWTTILIPKDAVYFRYSATVGSLPKYVLTKIEYIWDNVRALEENNKVVNSYLSTSVPNIAAGSNYAEDAIVKTNDEQFRAMSKVSVMNINKPVVIGGLYTYNSNTYQALKNVDFYDGYKDPYYLDGDYAIGCPTIYTINIDTENLSISENSDITVTIGTLEQTVTIHPEDQKENIAAAIASAFSNIEGWQLVDNLDGTLSLRCRNSGYYYIARSYNIGDTGLSITNTVTYGNHTLTRYNDGAWTNISLANWVADLGENAMWSSALSYEDLLSLTKDAYVPKLYDSFGTNINGAINQKTLSEYVTYETDTSIGILHSSARCITSANDWSSTGDHGFRYKQVFPGEHYRIKANANAPCNFAWLYSYNVSTTNGPYFVPGYGRLGIAAGKELDVTVPEFSDKERCVYLYTTYKNAGVDMTPEYIHKITYSKDIILEHTDTLDNIYNNYILAEEDLGNISGRPFLGYCIAQSTNKWTTDTDAKSHYMIPVEGYDYFKITANNDWQTVYAWLTTLQTTSAITPSSTPPYTQNEPIFLVIAKGTTAYTQKVPKDAKYLYLTRFNNRTNGAVNDLTPAAIYGYKGVSRAMSNVLDRVSAVEGNKSLPKTYYGGKIDLNTYRFNYITWFTDLDYTHQSGACYGKYYFMIQGTYGGMRVVNLETGTVIYTGSTGVTGKSGIRYHCNQCTFGITKYAESDPFPLLYVTVQEDDAFETRCSQDVFRVVATFDEVAQEYTSFTLVQVQLIWLPTMTPQNCLGNANMAIDTERKRMVFYSRYDGSPSNHWCKITEMNIPSFTPAEEDELQIVTLEDSNILNSYFIDSPAGDMQGGCILAGKLFIARGYASHANTQLIVVDLIRKCQLAMLDLYKYGFSEEPEGCFVYDNTVCISTNGNNFYKFAFE